jgi:site-specific DNA recombinase
MLTNKSNNSYILTAIYARVSSEQQAKSGTINSQVDALLTHAQKDGIYIEPELRFIDDGYSGSTIIRPALERMRDQAAAGSFNRIYVLNPCRLARNYAYQVLLLDELKRNNVEVIFLNSKISENPEDKLLLQVQGIIAEYERTKILERSRRGKLHAARKGSVNVMGNAPYGYKYISKNEGGGTASYEIILQEAKVVRQIFEWVGIEGYSLGKVCKCLQDKEILTRTGKRTWDKSVIWGMLKNPVYKGKAAFGKTEIGEMRPRLRVHKRSSEQPRRAYSTYDVPEGEWISIPVPPIVDEKLFAIIQGQFNENRKRNRERQRGARHLLQGLLVCKKCGYAYYGKPVSNSAAKGKKRDYVYYRCIGSDAYRFGGERICSNKQVRSDTLEQAVWNDIYNLLSEPGRIEEEYKRRLTISEKNINWDIIGQMQKKIKDVRRGISRLIDSYEDGLIEKDEFEPRIKRAKMQLGKLEAEIKEANEKEERIKTLQLIIGKLKDFADKVQAGLNKADWITRREIIRALIKRIEIDTEEVNIVYKISPDSFINAPEKKSLQHRRRRH